VVEFAVVASVFFVIVLGILEVARGLMVSHLVSNAARLGCRTAILPGKSTEDITSVVKSVLTAEGVNGGKISVEVNDADKDAATAQAGDRITVIVSVPVKDVTWVPGGHFLSGNLTGRSSLRRE